MSTLSLPSKSSEGTFSYAAAASGKHSPKPTSSSNFTQSASQTSNSGTSTPNGISTESIKGHMMEVPSSQDSGSTPKQTASNTSETTSSGYTAAVNGESPLTTSDDQKPSNDEKSSTHEKEVYTEDDIADTGKQNMKAAEAAKEKLIPAPPPTVNIWNLRAEEFKAKAKSQPATTPVAPPTTPGKPTTSKLSDKATDTKQLDRKRGNKQMDAGNLDTEKVREGGAHDRKDSPKGIRDRKKSADAGRVNGYLPREDGTIRHGKPHKHIGKSNTEKESPATELPPSLGDATSWPTPETAQDEEKKEKERLQAEKEKEKPTVVRSSGPTKFVPAPFTPTIVHSAPLPTKSGRGGRGGRGGANGRGGHSSVSGAESRERADKPEKAVGLTQSTEDGGRGGSRGPGLGGRGTHHSGSRGGRRTGSVSSTTPRKDESPLNSLQDRKEPQPPANKVSGSVHENVVNSDPGTPAQAVELRQEVQNLNQRPEDEGAFIGQGVIPPQYIERPERVHGHSFTSANGQGYQRADGSNIPADGFPQGRSERGNVNARGGYKGRGNHYNTQHPHSSHSNTISTQPYQHHTQTQYPPHTPSYRGYSRGSRGQSGVSRGYHPPHYQPAVYPSQPYPPPYPYYDYNTNALNNPMNGVPLMNMNATNSPIGEEALAHRDYPHAKDYYANVLRDLTLQMEYYFSVDNLCKDVYLRKHMDSEGWVSLAVFAGFGMIRKHTTNIELIRDACQASQDIEVQLAIDGYRVRKAVNYKAFVMPREERLPEVQQREYGNMKEAKEATEAAHNSEAGRSQMSAAAAPFQPTLHQRQSISSIQSATHSIQPVMNGSPVQGSVKSEPNGIERTHSQLSADAAEFTMPNGFTSTSQTEPQSELQSQSADFPDDKIDDIIIIYKKSLLDNATSPEDSPAVNGELSSICNSEDPTETCPCSPRSGRLSRHGVGWTMEPKPEGANGYKHEHEEYTRIRTAALQKRLEGEPDLSKMIILYRFWSHFLMNQFNRKMYEEFKSLAVDDASVTSGLSVEILFGFYEAVHLTGFSREDISRDFVTLARKLATDGTNVGLSRLEATIKNPHLKPMVGNILHSLSGTLSHKAA